MKSSNGNLVPQAGEAVCAAKGGLGVGVETITTTGLINQTSKHDKNPSRSKSPASSNAGGAKCGRGFTPLCISLLMMAKLEASALTEFTYEDEKT